jgi:histidinol-phosphate aminotransferase
MSTLSRRNWFKSGLAAAAGMTITSSFVSELMAAPVSRAEHDAWGFGRASAQGKVRLNANENPYGPSEKARQAVTQILGEGNRYPFAAMTELKEALARKEGVDPEYIHLGAGSGELLCQAGVAWGLQGGSVLSAYPTFPMLMNFAEGVKAQWVKVNLNDKLEHDFEAMTAAIRSDVRLIFVCNPNNPTGTAVDSAKVAAFCEEASKRAVVYSDEAYLEFLEPSQQRSMTELVKKGANVIVSKTFSKIYGLAGIRIGYVVAHPDNIRKMARYGDDISISQTAIAAARASIGDEEFMKLTRTRNAAAREVLTTYLDQKKIFYGKSLTNVVLFPAPADGRKILTRMEEKGYLIRVWEYQQKEWCRVSIGTAEEMKGFVKAFDEFVA